MDEKQLERIKQMEEYLNELEHLIIYLNNALDKTEESIIIQNKLVAYYMSNDWQQDYKASNQADFPTPAKLPHGVLSEDAIWNVMIDYKELGERMVAIGLKMKGKTELE